MILILDMQAINFITQWALTQPLKNVVWARLQTQQEFQIANMYYPLYYVVDDGKLEGFWCDIERIKCRKNSEKCQRCFFYIRNKRVKCMGVLHGKCQEML